MTSIVRGKINRGDMAFWDGKNATSSRVDATGGSVSGLAINDFVDLLQVFGAGTARTSGTCGTAIGFVGSVTCCFRFAPGAWVFTSNITFPSTVTCYVAAGATIEPATGVTVTFSGPVIHEATTWTGGLGTVTTSIGGAALIPIQDSGGFYTATDVEGALAELASTATGNGASIIGLEDSGGFYTATNVEAALAELASVATGNGASIIGVEDSASNFAGTDVEAVLAELQASIDVFTTAGTFTGTLTGMTASTTLTMSYTIINNVCFLYTSATFVGTSNTTAMTMTGLPSAIQPAVNCLGLCEVKDNGNPNSGSYEISSGTSVVTFRFGVPLSTTGFTAGGSKGLDAGWSISYLLS